MPSVIAISDTQKMVFVVNAKTKKAAQAEAKAKGGNDAQFFNLIEKDSAIESARNAAKRKGYGFTPIDLLTRKERQAVKVRWIMPVVPKNNSTR